MAVNVTFKTSVKQPGCEELMAQMKFKPVLDVPSKLVKVQYSIPFGLNVEPRDNFVMCTKDRPWGGRTSVFGLHEPVDTWASLGGQCHHHCHVVQQRHQLAVFHVQGHEGREVGCGRRGTC